MLSSHERITKRSRLTRPKQETALPSDTVQNLQFVGITGGAPFNGREGRRKVVTPLLLKPVISRNDQTTAPPE
jgi:hypothetical protein